MTDWKEYSLEELFSIPLRNGLNKPSKIRGTGFRMVNMKEIFGYDFIGDDTPMELVPLTEKEKVAGFLEKGDLLFARQSLVASGAGKIAYYRGSLPTVFESHLIRCRLNSKLSDPKYIYYLIKSPQGRGKVETIVEQTAAAGIRGSDLKALKFSLPPLATQTAIAEILSSLDDKIELNNQINRELEALAQALFKRWFVDFEFPDEKGVPYKSSGGAMMESALGEIPLGWRVGTLDEIIDFNPTEKIRAGTDATYIDMASIPTQGTWPQKPITRAMGSGMKFRNGDTLFARITPCLQNGKTAFIQCLEENEVAWGSTEFIVLRPKNPWPKELGYLVARNSDFRIFAEQHMTGTSGRQRVQSSDLAKYEITYPTDQTLIKSFGELMQNFFSEIENNSKEAEELSTLRDTLLPKLISGEVEV